uniref:Uncharacterized protein n=1 Tax=Desulfobacca acetoxidans TaxID=60893 RepID=A0A7C3SHJ3_9BACT
MEPDYPQQQISAPGQEGAVLLEIQGEEIQGTMRLPVTICGVGNNQVVLRLDHLLPEFMEDSLINRPAGLFLAVPEEPEIVEAAGKVAWLKFSGQGHPQMLALELAEAHPKFLTLARKLMVYAKTDLKELWERWDQANHRGLENQPLNHHVGLALMVAGIVLNLAGSGSSAHLASYFLILFGGLVAGVKNLIPLRWRRIRST